MVPCEEWKSAEQTGPPVWKCDATAISEAKVPAQVLLSPGSTFPTCALRQQHGAAVCTQCS